MKFFSSSLIEAFIYSVWFYIIFLMLFIQNASDGTPTTGMFAFVIVGIVVLDVLFFWLVSYLLQLKNIQPNLFLNALIMYIISELVFFIVSGEWAFFGLLHVLLKSHSPDKELSDFRRSTELVFSFSSVLANCCSIIQHKLLPLKKLPANN